MEQPVFLALYTIEPHRQRNLRVALVGAIATIVLVLVIRTIFLAALLSTGSTSCEAAHP